jgi:hypothetical protein
MLANRKANERVMPPYRDSKLTRILESSLKYDSKTVMIVTVCSDASNFKQTKESLNFAASSAYF